MFRFSFANADTPLLLSITTRRLRLLLQLEQLQLQQLAHC
jgi:hypothetical protein